MIWHQPSLISLVHHGVRRFNVFGEELRIEQWHSRTIFR